MIEIYNNGTIEKNIVSIDGYSILENYFMIAKSGGTATHTTVASGGVLFATGGSVTDTAVTPGGTMSCTASGTDGIQVLGGTLEIKENGVATDVEVRIGGHVVISNGGSLNKGVVYWGDVSADNGTVCELSFQAGTLSLNNGATADRIILLYDGAAIEVGNGGLARNSRVDGTVITVKAGGVAESTVLNDYSLYFPSIKETVYYHATMTLKSGAVHRGSLTIDSGSSVAAEKGSIIDFTLTNAIAGSESALINNFSRITGTPDFTMTVTANQAVGVYALASSVSAFSAPVALQCESYSALNLAVGGTTTYHDRVYSLSLANAALIVDVADYTTSATANQLNWNEINDAVSYAVELSGGSHNIEVEIGTQGADLLGLANGDYTWQVRNSAEVDNRQTGEAFSQSSAPQEPQVLSAETNTLTDVFFANVDGTWGKGFEAMHVGCKDGWTGTLETVNLAGKSRITDIFAGSDDASVLVLTDDSENGMALFVDDIYSAACGTPEQARLSKIDTIYATAGDDIIDLTSQSFGFANGVTVYGGAGNDVIWANSKENMLFGEAGDDSIVGGNEDDVIIGGIGNDTLHGGGGDDVFCFGDGWGVDTVEQLASGSVVLWFNENSGTWDETTLTYTQGDNSVSVFGVTSVELRFGSAEGHEEQYAVLSASGAFA